MPFKLSGLKVVTYNNGFIRFKCDYATICIIDHMPGLTMVYPRMGYKIVSSHNFHRLRCHYVDLRSHNNKLWRDHFYEPLHIPHLRYNKMLIGLQAIANLQAL